MITFTFLAVILLAIMLVVALVLGVSLTAFFAVFGDLIVCILLIIGLVKLFRRKKKK